MEMGDGSREFLETLVGGEVSTEEASPPPPCPGCKGTKTWTIWCHHCRGLGAFWRPCSTCDGTGVFHEKCPTCRGLAIFPESFQKTVNSLETCSHCKGKGSRERWYSGACRECKGSGSKLMGTRYTVCSGCDGTGRVRSDSMKTETCESCHGQGQVFRKYKKRERRDRACDRCAGTGKLSKQCHECKGRRGILEQCWECEGKGKLRMSCRRCSPECVESRRKGAATRV